MNIKEFYETYGDLKLTVVMNDDVHHYIEDSFDSLMAGDIVKVSKSNGSYTFHIDMSNYEEYNKSVAEHNWRNEDGEPIVSWFETKHYPKDGVEIFTLKENTKLPFEVISRGSLFKEYLDDNVGVNYTKWLEETLIEFRHIYLQSYID